MLCAGVKNGSLNQHQLCSKHWGIERKCTAMIHSAFIFKKKKEKKRQQRLRRRLLSKASSSQSTGIKVWISLLSATLDPIPTQQHQFFFFLIFFKKAYEQLVEEHFSPQLMFRPAVLAQCLTWDHMQSCLEVCMLLCLIRSVWWLQMWCISKKQTNKKLFMLCCRMVLKTWLRELVMLGSVVCCRLLTTSSCLSIFFNNVKSAGSILDIQCKHKILLQSESSRLLSALFDTRQSVLILFMSN